MTEAEKIWTDKLLEVAKERGGVGYDVNRKLIFSDEAACRLIEEFEAFRREVSDAVSDTMNMLEIHCRIDAQSIVRNRLSRFIIAKPEPDPLEVAMRKALPASMPDHHVKAICKNLRREVPGLKIVEVDDD